jgi:tRNA pseudouridine55 synthase
VGGRRAYELARRGEAVETQARPVTVLRSELLWHEGDRAAFEVECSAGTYVRTLIADLGDAYCEELERSAIGPFRLEDALAGPLPPDPAAALMPLSDALGFLAERPLSLEEAQAVRHGRRVPAAGAEGPHVRLTAGPQLVAIGERRADELQPVVVFEPA